MQLFFSPHPQTPKNLKASENLEHAFGKMHGAACCEATKGYYHRNYKCNESFIKF